MKKIIALAISLTFAATGTLFADAKAGEKLYKSKGCSSCHHPTKDQLAQGMGPSYQMVSAAYKKGAGKAGIMKFLNGEGEPIVAPEKASIMKGQVRNTKKWTDEQRGDIADFILTH
ncbi:MAG: c-type cytochrome [Spirochaetia bacterium]|nr:c-type cytochrome [Spirochaetia bacterium]